MRIDKNVGKNCFSKYLIFGLTLVMMAPLPLNATARASPTPGGMRIGVTYYGNYQDWSGISDSVLNRDFAFLSSKGIDVIILPTFWNVLEKSKGSYNSAVFTRLNHITDIAAQY